MKLYKARHILKDIRDDNADEYDNDTIMDAIDTVINKFESGADGIVKDSIVAAFNAYGLENSSEKVREWAKSHPEKPKVTNGDKAKEIFGKEFNPCNICGNAGKKCDDLKECGFDFYEWWKSEYKEPENG